MSSSNVDGTCKRRREIAHNRLIVICHNLRLGCQLCVCLESDKRCKKKINLNSLLCLGCKPETRARGGGVLTINSGKVRSEHNGLYIQLELGALKLDILSDVKTHDPRLGRWSRC